jgi:hypothetical protein
VRLSVGLHAVQISNRASFFAIFPFILQGTTPENGGENNARVDSGAEAMCVQCCVLALATLVSRSIHSVIYLNPERRSLLTNSDNAPVALSHRASSLINKDRRAPKMAC